MLTMLPAETWCISGCLQSPFPERNLENWLFNVFVDMSNYAF